MSAITKAAISIFALSIAVALIINGEIAKSGFLAQDILKEESFNYTVNFCASDDCPGLVAAALRGARSTIECAFYRADSYVFGNVSAAATAAFVLDEKAKIAGQRNISVFKSNGNGIMHNKYCVIDHARIITGSFNPTAAAKNDYNNLIMINSSFLAGFYMENFEFLKTRSNQKHKTKKPVMLNRSIVEAYFCPIDDCAGAVERKIARANSSIFFAAYSFTHPDIANEIILKESEGVSVSGVFEKSMAGTSYSKHALMAANGVSVRLETSGRLMHHKFFVIDNETVITGSFNPTANAAEKNDENLLIIKNKNLATAYYKEFSRILSAGD